MTIVSCLASRGGILSVARLGIHMIAFKRFQHLEVSTFMVQCQGQHQDFFTEGARMTSELLGAGGGRDVGN